MVGIAKVLDAIYSKLEDETKILVIAYTKLDKFMNAFDGTGRVSSLEFENLILKTRIFIHHTLKIMLEYAKITEGIKKTSKKISITPRDVDSYTKKIESLNEKVKVVNVEAEALVIEAEILVKEYLATKK